LFGFDIGRFDHLPTAEFSWRYVGAFAARLLPAGNTHDGRPATICIARR
jgi:hypothetical protein